MSHMSGKTCVLQSLNIFIIFISLKCDFAFILYCFWLCFSRVNKERFANETLVKAGEVNISHSWLIRNKLVHASHFVCNLSALIVFNWPWTTHARLRHLSFYITSLQFDWQVWPNLEITCTDSALFLFIFFFGKKKTWLTKEPLLS